MAPTTRKQVNPLMADVRSRLAIPRSAYVDVPTWLASLAADYDLSLGEMVVLALIYGYSADMQPRAVTVTTAAAWSGARYRNSATKTLRKLVDLGLIAKGKDKQGRKDTYVALINPTSAEYTAEHFCRLYWWMLSDLALPLPQALLYATVHGFYAAAQGGDRRQQDCLFASLTTITGWLHLGRSTVVNGLSALVAAGLITKTTVSGARGRVCEYRIVPSKLPSAAKPAKGKTTDAAVDPEPTERERKLAEIDAETHAAIRRLSAEAARRKWDVDHPDGSDRDYYASRALRNDIGAFAAGEVDFRRRHPELHSDFETLAAYEHELAREARAKKEARRRHGC